MNCERTTANIFITPFFLPSLVTLFVNSLNCRTRFIQHESIGIIQSPNLSNWYLRFLQWKLKVLPQFHDTSYKGTSCYCLQTSKNLIWNTNRSWLVAKICQRLFFPKKWLLCFFISGNLPETRQNLGKMRAFWSEIMSAAQLDKLKMWRLIALAQQSVNMLKRVWPSESQSWAKFNAHAFCSSQTCTDVAQPQKLTVARDRGINCDVTVKSLRRVRTVCVAYCKH